MTQQTQTKESRELLARRSELAEKIHLAQAEVKRVTAEIDKIEVQLLRGGFVAAGELMHW